MAEYLRRELMARVREDPTLFAFLEQGCLDGLFYWDIENPQNEWLSPRFKAFFGFAEDEMADSPDWWRANVDPEDWRRAEVQIERCFADPDEPFDMIMRYRHRHGHPVWVRCRGLIQRDAAGRPIRMLGAHTDVTALKIREAELSESNAQLDEALREARAANAAKSHFLAKMSHEIRTPMTGVLGMADLLARTPLDPEQARMLEAIGRSGRLLMATLNDILDVSKIEAGMLTSESAPFSLDDLAAQVETLHAAKATETATAFSVSVIGSFRRRRGDAHRLAQILNNLVGNALKFAAGAEVAVVIDGRAPDMLALSVRDTGIGMSPEAADRVFLDYAQADASIARRFGGTGLGLSIVKGLVDLMQGRITLETAEGAGARFALTIPSPAQAQIEDAAAGLPAREDEAVAGLRVLACDDNEINRMVLDGFLGQLPVARLVLPDGAAMVEAAGSGDWDVCLIDIVMPDLSGQQTLQALRRRELEDGRPPVRAVACTAHAMPNQVAEYLAAGFDAHLPKPIDPAALSSVLFDAAGGRGPRETGRPQ
jgi:PAS domain S-box-containing protein